MIDDFVVSLWKPVFENNHWSVLDKKNKVIVTLQGSANTEKNAKLIAAGPYMLEALKSMIELIGDEDLPDNGELSGAAICDMVRSAVNLAGSDVN